MFLIEIILNIWRVERKKLDVVFLYKHVMAFLSKAEITYIFPTELKPIFKFSLKSRNLKWLITLLKSHSEERTALIE